MYIRIKRLIDFFAALTLLLLFSPLITAIAALILLTGGGRPVLFRQKRPGKGGKVFTINKFRTMAVHPAESSQPLSDMERMTRIGRFLRAVSLDELPQLLNVIKGDMSFIGPRPLLVEYLPLYSPRQARRHEVLPGITGLAQIYGRNAITWEEKFEYDVAYVEGISFTLDFKILMRTVIKVIKREGINCDADNTMQAFTGSPDTVPLNTVR